MSLTMQENPRQGAPIPLSDAEWHARVQLAACYRVFDLMGWVETIFNHITLRVPGPERQFLINPFGLMYHEVTASNLVAVDIEGRPVRPTGHAVNRAGFVTHSAIHGHLDQAHCVMHTHTTSGMAVACLEQGLSHDSFYGAQLHGRVAYHEFEGITVHADEGERILASAGGKPVLMLRNHGPVTIGATLPQCLALMWLVQRACEVQLATLAMGRPRAIAQPVLEACVRDSLQFSARYGAGQDSFDALQRLVDRIDPTYRS